MIGESQRSSRRIFLGRSASFLGEVTLAHVMRKSLLAGVSLESINAIWNAHRTLDSLQHTLQPSPPYDAVVVLGAGSASLNGKEVPAPDGQLRVIAGAEEYRKNPKIIILFSGGARSGTPEAIVMNAFAQDYFLIPNSARQIETKSVDTVTQIREIIEWKKQNPKIKKIGVSTNAYHMKGVQVLGRNLGIDLYPVVAEQVLVDTGRADLINRVKDFYADSSLSNKIEKEQARITMLLLDPESHISHERIQWQKKDPRLQEAFDKIYKALAIAGRQLFPLDLKPVV